MVGGAVVDEEKLDVADEADTDLYADLRRRFGIAPGTELVTLALDDVVLDDEIWPRRSEDWPTVGRYIAARKSGVTLPPITVGLRDGKYINLDGRHRYRAAQNMGDATIVCIVSAAKPADFFLEATLLNAKHGHPLSNAERLSAAERLRDEGRPADVIEAALAAPIGELIAPALGHASSAAAKSAQVPASGADAAADPASAARVMHALCRDMTKALTLIGGIVAEGNLAGVPDSELDGWLTRAEFAAEELRKEKLNREKARRAGGDRR